MEPATTGNPRLHRTFAAGRFPAVSDDVFRWRGRLGPFELKMSPTTFAPSTVSALVADALSIEEGETVIDVGCGSGVLAIIAAKLGAGRVHATDASEDVVDIGTANAQRLGVGDRVSFYRGDLFSALPADVSADVIIGDVSGIPDELAAESGWFPGGVGGGPTGSELPIRMLREAKERLRAPGRLILPTGSLQDEPAILAVARSLFGKVRKLTDRVIPLPAALAASGAVPRLVAAGIVRISPKGSRWTWEARVWELAP